MWASEKARNRAIMVMLSGSATMARMWTQNGPTPEALDLIEADGGPLSGGEKVLLRAAFDLYNGTGKCTVDSLLCTLDADNLRAVAAAVLARDEGEPRSDFLGRRGR
jgi:hypothetical protein